jgi:hypothetical protein
LYEWKEGRHVEDQINMKQSREQEKMKIWERHFWSLIINYETTEKNAKSGKDE